MENNSPRINMKQLTEYDATTISDNNGKDWYFWFDDDNKMRYKYILSITESWMGNLYARIVIYCKEIKRKIERTNYILDVF